MAQNTRPTVAVDRAHAREAEEAVAALVEELQQGWDSDDADISDRHLAEDVVWGSPFGATVRGYEELHSIHRRLKRQHVGGEQARFEPVQILVPTTDVAVAQVRRVALDPNGEPVAPDSDFTGPFSEMALYVLVKRDGSWWLSAGQNTPVRD
jgi:uncharacterized protein (TIGR02246 family)